MDFYSVDALADAKVRLINDVNSLNLQKQLPHISQRRGGDGRLALEANDIFTVLTFADEAKIMDHLPKYVASSPDRMPSLRLYEGDLQVLMEFMQKLSDKVDRFGSALSAITRDVQAIQVWPSLPAPACQQSTTGRSSIQAAQPRQHKQQPVLDQSSWSYNHDREITIAGAVAGSSSRSADGGAATDWASQSVSTPYAHVNRFAALSTDDGDRGGEDDDDDDGPYTTQRHRNKRQRQQSSQMTATQPGQRQPQQRQQPQLQQRPPAAQRRSIPSLYGKSTKQSNIVAAGKLRQRAVFCVDNVSTECSKEGLCDFVAKLSVKVFSCFEAKPRRRRDEESAPDRKAYRLCIDKDDVDKLLNPAAWPHSIVISEWFFKPPDSKPDETRRSSADVGAQPSCSSRDDAGAAAGGGGSADDVRSSHCTTDTTDTTDSRPADNGGDVVDELESAMTDDERTIIMADHNIQDGDEC